MRHPYAKHQTLEGVTLTILEDLHKHRNSWRRAFKYSPLAVLKKVIEQKQSVASCLTKVPNYLWCTIELDGCEPYPDIDLGCLPATASIAHSKVGAVRINTAKHIHEHLGAWYVVDGGFRFESMDQQDNFLLQKGISLGQDFLVRGVFDCYGSYDDYDESWDVELLYVEPNFNPLYLPVWSDLA